MRGRLACTDGVAGSAAIEHGAMGSESLLGTGYCLLLSQAARQHVTSMFVNCKVRDRSIGEVVQNRMRRMPMHAYSIVRYIESKRHGASAVNTVAEDVGRRERRRIGMPTPNSPWASQPCSSPGLSLDPARHTPASLLNRYIQLHRQLEILGSRS